MPATTNKHQFDASLFRFLRQLKRNNNREWFQQNKDRYESEVLNPSLEFIRAFARPLQQISPHFVASDKRVGGSLMRVYRDTRFSKDKTPYKTNVGVQFRHEQGKDVHCPGFYIHLDDKECFLGVGLWHPDNKALARIRTALDQGESQWKRASRSRSFLAHFHLAGDSLKRVPRGYDQDHPLADDLRRKDFIAVKDLERDAVLSADFVQSTTQAFKAARPLMRFLCHALTIPF